MLTHTARHMRTVVPLFAGAQELIRRTLSLTIIRLFAAGTKRALVRPGRGYVFSHV